MLSLQFSKVFSEESPKCPTPPESLEALDPKSLDFITSLVGPVKKEACNKSIFSDITDPKFIVNHNKLRCSEIDTCIGESHSEAVIKDASELLKENLPKAVLLGVIDLEVQAKLKYNIILKRFEKSNDKKICPSEEIETSCERDIRNALSSVSASFIDYPALTVAPALEESTEDYFSKIFFSANSYKNRSMTEEELLKGCGDKINFTKICKARDLRLKVISDCEKNPQSKGCLDQEQNALASLLNSQKDRKDIFLAMEQQLCKDSRLVHDSTTPYTLGSIIPKSGLGVKLNSLAPGKLSIGPSSAVSGPGLKLKLDTNVDSMKVKKTTPAEDPAESSPSYSLGSMISKSRPSIGLKADALPLETLSSHSSSPDSGLKLKLDTNIPMVSSEQGPDDIGSRFTDTARFDEPVGVSDAPLGNAPGEVGESLSSAGPSYIPHNSTMDNISSIGPAASPINSNPSFNPADNEEDRVEVRGSKKRAPTATASADSKEEKNQEQIAALENRISELQAQVTEMEENNKENAVDAKIDVKKEELKDKLAALKKEMIRVEKIQEDARSRARIENQNVALPFAKSPPEAPTKAAVNNPSSGSSFVQPPSASAISSNSPVIGKPNITLYSGTGKDVVMTEIESEEYLHLDGSPTSDDIKKKLLENNATSAIVDGVELVTADVDKQGNIVGLNRVKIARKKERGVASVPADLKILDEQDQNKSKPVRYEELQNTFNVNKMTK